MQLILTTPLRFFRASIERLADNGAYLVENGISLFLYIGLQVDAGWIKDIFDVDSLQQVHRLMNILGTPALVKRVSDEINSPLCFFLRHCPPS